MMESSKRGKIHTDRRGRTPLHSMPVKVTAFILMIIFIAVAAASAVGVLLMLEYDVYITSNPALHKELFFGEANGIAYNVVHRIANDKDDLAREYLEYRNIAYMTVTKKGVEAPIFSFESGMKPEEYVLECVWASTLDDDGRGDWYSIDLDAIDDEKYEQYNIYTVTVTPGEELIYEDMFFWYDLMIDLLYVFRYWIYPIGLGSALLALLCFVFLLCSAGRRWGKEEVSGSFATKLPFDLLSALIAVGFIGGMLLSDSLYQPWETVCRVLVIAATFIAFVFWCMSLALRIKLGVLIKNTLIYAVLHLLWKVVRAVFSFFKTVICGIPLVWKTAILLCICAIFEIVILFLSHINVIFGILIWLLTKVTVYPAIIYFALMLSRLSKGAKEIASGKAEHEVDTRGLFLDLKTHAEDLNRIGEGINLAIEERMKGERMKTELITNVSHDIKTPLTSIINYSDLIWREECDNPRITEYAEVLHRQSERMKRLIEDLVEASKASSGNIDVVLVECDAGVFVSQAAGEYQQKLEAACLELVCTVPEEQIKILADGRRLWRVFDNLMSNISKYALGGTRVYLTLEKRGRDAVFSFKNISRDPLSVSADELTERFVRGDASRNTEGNGLGLSIAKSLTDLQGGRLDIITDGDLFKVELTFPIIG